MASGWEWTELKKLGSLCSAVPLEVKAIYSSSIYSTTNLFNVDKKIQKAKQNKQKKKLHSPPIQPNPTPHTHMSSSAEEIKGESSQVAIF